MDTYKDKMYGFYCLFLCIIIYLQEQCQAKLESKNPLPYFRRQIEEVVEDTTTQNSIERSHSNLELFLIKNVKKIFNELEDNELSEITTPLTTKTLFHTHSSLEIYDTTTEFRIEITKRQSDFSNKDIIPHRTEILETQDTTKSVLVNNTISELKPYFHEIVYCQNCTASDFSQTKFFDTESSTFGNELEERKELMHLSKNLIIFETDRRERENDNYFAHNASFMPSSLDTGLRSCIFCNNVQMENCNNPSNRLITSTVCERDDDVCYSLHTPFGVVDRGCFNVNHNLTTFVCACNLCNYISISEMPYIFSSQQEWVDNMVELSRTKHLRKSVYKDMACLKCESNASAKTGDMLDTANCLEGNIGSLPTEECEEDEICAVKAVKHDGYLWRGCVKQPLYNYWWGFCDTDLCNYEKVNSIFNTD